MRLPLRLFLPLLLLSSGTLLANELTVVPRAEWDALEARPFRKQTPKRFTIHHSGVRFETEQDAAQHIANVQRWGMGEDRGWSDIPYHFLIAPDGTVFEGRDPKTEGESNTSYDTAGHLQINLLGNFNEQTPTAEQLDSLVQLLVQTHRIFGIPVDTIRAHRDFASTACPGENLYKLVEDGTLRARVEAALSGENRSDG